MSFPNIPDVEPDMTLSAEAAANLILSSIAFEELGLAHIINSEAEKIQYALGTIEGQTPIDPPPTIDDLIAINQSVEDTLKAVIKTQILLQFKLEDALDISTTTSTTTTTTTTTTTSTTTTTTTTTKDFVEAGSAWSDGIDFGTGNAQYFTLEPGEDSVTVNFGLGANHIDIGSVTATRNNGTIDVTITTDSPFVMSEAHLYVSNVAPTNSAPGLFPYQFDPGVFFSTHTFEDIDVSGFAGETIFIAAHAAIFEPAD